MNRVILIGRLAKDPEIRITDSGIAMCRFTLAVDRPYIKQKRETDFIDIVAWRRLAEVCTDYLKKGQLAAVEGRLEIQSYTNSEGKRRRVAQVVAGAVRFLSPKKETADIFDGVEVNEDVPF